MADTSVEDTSRLPNALTIAAMEEGDRIVNDPTRKRHTLSKARAELQQ